MRSSLRGCPDASFRTCKRKPCVLVARIVRSASNETRRLRPRDDGKHCDRCDLGEVRIPMHPSDMTGWPASTLAGSAAHAGLPSRAGLSLFQTAPASLVPNHGLIWRQPSTGRRRVRQASARAVRDDALGLRLWLDAACSSGAMYPHLLIRADQLHQLVAHGLRQIETHTIAPTGQPKCASARQRTRRSRRSAKRRRRMVRHLALPETARPCSRVRKGDSDRGDSDPATG